MAHKAPPPRGPQLELANDLCVAFVNTAGASKDNRQQGIENYRELLSWGRTVGTVSSPEALRLGSRATEQPELAAEVWAWARKLRSALFRLFLAVMADNELPAADLDLVNEAVSGALGAARMVPGEKGLTLAWAGDEDALERVLWPVLHAAMQLLLSLEGRPWVRQCAKSGCKLFFVDRSPSGRRKWCGKICGKRDKSLRFYYRRGRAQRMASMDKVLGRNRRRRRPNKNRKRDST